MTTTLYPRSDSALDGTRTAEVHRGTNTAKRDGTATGWKPLMLHTTRGIQTTFSVFSAPTVTGPTNGVEVALSGVPFEWISLPVDQDVTIAGTITVNIWGLESNMSANVAINAILERLDSTGAIISTIATTARTVEMNTVSAVNNFTVTPTSTNMLKGDRFRLRIYGDDAGTMATAFTFDVHMSGDTAAVDGDSWIQFTETFGLQTTEPAGSQLFLTDTAGPAVGANIEKEMWTSRGGGVDSIIVNTAAGWLTPVQWTNAAGGTAVEWYSKPLSAFTLSGPVRLNLRALESNATAQVGIRAELAVCNGDGSGAVVWAAASLIDSTGLGLSKGAGTDIVGELSTTEQAIRSYLAGDDTSVTDGQRLRLRVFTDDCANSAQVTAFTATLFYDGTSSAASGDSFITLSQTVTEFVSGLTLTGSVASIKVSGVAGTVSGGGTATISGTVASVKVNGVTGSAAGSSPVSITGAVGSIRVTGVAGTLTPGPASIAGSVALVKLSGVAGTVSAPATITGAVASVKVQGVAGALTLPPVTITGSIASIKLSGVAGTVTVGTATITGAVASVHLAGVAGTAVGVGSASIPASVASVKVAGVAGALALGPVAVPGAIAAVQVIGVAGNPIPGLASLPGAVAQIRVVGVAGSLLAPQTISGAVASVRVLGVAGTAAATGTATVAAALAHVQVVGVPGAADGSTFIAGAVASVRVAAVAGAASGAGTGTISASVAQIRVVGVAGSMAGAGVVAVAASVALVRVSGVAGSLTPGPVTVTGAVLQLRVEGVTGAMQPGPTTIVGAVGSVRMLGVGGVMAGGPVSIAAAVLLVRVLGVAGSLLGFVPDVRHGRLTTVSLTEERVTTTLTGSRNTRSLTEERDTRERR